MHIVLRVFSIWKSSFCTQLEKKIKNKNENNQCFRGEVTQFTALFDSSHLFNKKDTSKDVNPRKACGSPFVTNESYICMITADILAFSFFCMVFTVQRLICVWQREESWVSAVSALSFSDKWASSRHSLIHTADSNEYYAYVLQHTTTHTHSQVKASHEETWKNT